MNEADTCLATAVATPVCGIELQKLHFHAGEGVSVFVSQEVGEYIGNDAQRGNFPKPEWGVAHCCCVAMYIAEDMGPVAT